MVTSLESARQAAQDGLSEVRNSFKSLDLGLHAAMDALGLTPMDALGLTPMDALGLTPNGCAGALPISQCRPSSARQTVHATTFTLLRKVPLME